MNRDTVTGIVGAVLLIAAMAGVFLYERGRAADLLGDAGATFESITSTGPGAQGTVQLNGQSTADIAISKLNLTRVEFTLTWTATNGRDTLSMTVAPPAGIEEGNVSEPEDDGSITVAVPVPNPEPVTGPQTLGNGTWRITVNFLAASGLGPAGAPPIQPDQQVAWAISTKLTAWEPQA